MGVNPGWGGSSPCPQGAYILEWGTAAWPNKQRVQIWGCWEVPWTFFPLYLRYFLSLADLLCLYNDGHSISNHVWRSGRRKQPELKGNPSRKSESYSWPLLAELCGWDGSNLRTISWTYILFLISPMITLSETEKAFQIVLQYLMGEVWKPWKESFSSYCGCWSFLNGKPVYKYYYPALLKIIEKWKRLQLQNNNYPRAGRPDTWLDTLTVSSGMRRGLGGWEFPEGPCSEPWPPPHSHLRVGAGWKPWAESWGFTHIDSQHAPPDADTSRQLRQLTSSTSSRNCCERQDTNGRASALCSNIFWPSQALSWSRQVIAAANAMGWVLFIYLGTLHAIRCLGTLSSSGRTL